MNCGADVLGNTATLDTDVSIEKYFQSRSLGGLKDAILSSHGSSSDLDSRRPGSGRWV